MIDRLTTWNGKKWVLPQGRTANGESYWRLIADRLAAYENTGLEPEEITPEPMAATDEEIDRFLVNAYTDGVQWSKVMTAAELFNMMDMADCSDIDIVVWKINSYTEALSECSFIPMCWDMADPLKMEIRWNGGGIIGYGTDH